MVSWKAYACVSLISSIPLVSFLAFWLSRPVTFTSAALLGLCYAWLLPKYTVPFFQGRFNHVPEPRSQSFWLAHGLAFFKQTRFLDYVQDTPNDGLIAIRGFFHSNAVLLLTSPEGVKEVLNDKPSDWAKPIAPTKFLETVLGYGLITAEGQEHKSQRKSVTPAFHGSHIKDLFPLFWKKSIHLTNVLSKQLEGTDADKPREGVVNIHSFSTRVTLDIIGLAGLGRDFNTLENDDDVIAKMFARLTNTDDSGTIKYFAACMTLPIWFVKALPWRMNQVFADATKKLRGACMKLVEETKVAALEKSTKHVDILSVMLRQSGSLSDEELTDQMLTFLAAGSETTGHSLVWIVYLLCKHQDIQEQVRVEVEKVLKNSKSDGEPDINAIDSLPLLTAIVNETLRFFPTIPVTGRLAIKPTSILGVEVPPGTEIVLSPWAMNRSTKVWGEDAQVWKPERWLGEGNALTGGAKHTYAFLTFLHGSRSCIGQGFARSELKYLVAAMVSKFQMVMADEDEVPEPVGAITFKPKNGLNVRLREL